MRQAYKLCREYLHGPWAKISIENIEVTPLGYVILSVDFTIYILIITKYNLKITKHMFHKDKKNFVFNLQLFQFKIKSFYMLSVQKNKHFSCKAISAYKMCLSAKSTKQITTINTNF